MEVRLIDLADSLKKAFRPLRAWAWKPSAIFLKYQIDADNVIKLGISLACSSINYSDVHLYPFYKTNPIQLTGGQVSELEKLQSMMGAEDPAPGLACVNLSERRVFLRSWLKTFGIANVNEKPVRA